MKNVEDQVSTKSTLQPSGFECVWTSKLLFYSDEEHSVFRHFVGLNLPDVMIGTANSKDQFTKVVTNYLKR